MAIAAKKTYRYQTELASPDGAENFSGLGTWYDWKEKTDVAAVDAHVPTWFYVSKLWDIRPSCM